MVEVQKLRTFYDFCGARATLCGDVQKLRTFYDFCKPRATLCGDRARRSALAVAPCEFVLVSANPLRRLRALAVAPRNILARETAFGSCLVVCAFAFAIPRARVRSPPGPRQLLKIAAFKYKRSTGWKIATFKYRRSARSVLPQLRLENRNF